MVICEPLDSHMAALDSTVDILVEDISDHECNARSTMLRNRIDALAAFHSFVQGISCFAAQLHVLQLTEAADRRNENKRSDRVSKQTLAWQTIHQKQNELLQLSKRLTTEAEKGVNGIRTLRKLAMDLEQRALVLQRDIGEARRAALRQQEQSEAELLEIESQLSQCLQLLATTERHIRELEGKVKDAEKTRNTFRWVRAAFWGVAVLSPLGVPLVVGGEIAAGVMGSARKVLETSRDTERQEADRLARAKSNNLAQQSAGAMKVASCENCLSVATRLKDRLHASESEWTTPSDYEALKEAASKFLKYVQELGDGTKEMSYMDASHELQAHVRLIAIDMRKTKDPELMQLVKPLLRILDRAEESNPQGGTIFAAVCIVVLLAVTAIRGWWYALLMVLV